LITVYSKIDISYYIELSATVKKRIDRHVMVY